MNIYNNHTHSQHSHDGVGKISEMAEHAIKGGLSGFAVTDHCDCEYYDNENMVRNILTSYKTSNEMKVLYDDKVKILSGIEIGESVFEPEFATEMIKGSDWDVVLASVHAVRIKDKSIPFSLIDFSSYTAKELDEYISVYFYDLLETAETTDYDILSHLTVVFRYIKYKYKKEVSLYPYMNTVEEILRSVIKRNKTLEINISGISDGYLMPDMEIIELYKSLGGVNFSIGNDSHKPEGICDGLIPCLNELKKTGIEKMIYFANRKPIEYQL